MKNYKSILENFCLKGGVHSFYSENNANFFKPFKFKNKVMATNTYALVSIPEKYIEEDYSNQTDNKRIKTLIDSVNEVNKNFTISVSLLKETLSKFPFVPNDLECECCEGYGEVEFIHKYNLKSYEIKYDCPICEGAGSFKSDNPNDVSYDYEKGVRIGLDFFNGDRIAEIIFVAEHLNVNEVKLIYQSDFASSKASLFKIDDVILMSMPMIKCDKKNIIAEIKID